jgi:hypothetical protein
MKPRHAIPDHAMHRRCLPIQVSPLRAYPPQIKVTTSRTRVHQSHGHHVICARVPRGILSRIRALIRARLSHQATVNPQHEAISRR